jgi:maleylacetoacetate isomerase
LDEQKPFKPFDCHRSFLGRFNMPQPHLELYHYWRSSCSWRVRWGLHLKGLSFQSRPVNLLLGEQRAAPYLAINPAGVVPTLIVDGTPMSESLAILEWLDECAPQQPLLPRDPLSRARVRELAYHITAGIQPLQNLKVLALQGPDQAERLRYGRRWINEGFISLEKRLVLTAGTYSFGGQLTIADLCLVPQVYNALRFGITLDAYPTIRRIHQHCWQLPTCHASAPDQQDGAG